MLRRTRQSSQLKQLYNIANEIELHVPNHLWQIKQKVSYLHWYSLTTNISGDDTLSECRKGEIGVKTLLEKIEEIPIRLQNSMATKFFRDTISNSILYTKFGWDCFLYVLKMCGPTLSIIINHTQTFTQLNLYNWTVGNSEIKVRV